MLKILRFAQNDDALLRMTTFDLVLCSISYYKAIRAEFVLAIMAGKFAHSGKHWIRLMDSNMSSKLKKTVLPDFEAVIFDFDGVVVDSTMLHIQCWEIAHQRMFGQSLVNPSTLIGEAGRHIARKLSTGQNQMLRWEELYELKTALLQEQEDELPVVPGLELFLRHLQEQAMPYSIGSNARRIFIEKVLSRNGQLNFPNIVCIDDVKRPKPHPDIFEQCAVNLGIPYKNRRSILVFEDSPIGIIAAVNAGMTPVGLTTQLPRNVLYNAGARIIIPHFLDLMEP